MVEMVDGHLRHDLDLCGGRKMVKGVSLRRESICQTVEGLGVEGFTDDPEVLVTAKSGTLEAICKVLMER